MRGERLTHPPYVSRLAPHPGTVGSAVERARRLLESAGVPDAGREAAELYAALVAGGAALAWLERDRPLAPGLGRRLDGAARRRAAGWPQAYAAGRANFRGLWLAVDGRVLIPRPETEGLVDLALDAVRAAAAPSPAVADVGTGSGAIAIALAVESPGSALLATDREAAALAVARENVAAHGVAERVRVCRGDLLEAVGGEVLDVVVSNPPYVASGEWAGLEPAVRDHEPRAALDGGADGLEPTRRLLGGAARALRPGGVVVVEVDERRATATAALARAAGFAACAVLEDLSGRPRYLRARRPADGSD